jgi:hypothetical protein
VGLQFLMVTGLIKKKAFKILLDMLQYLMSERYLPLKRLKKFTETSVTITMVFHSRYYCIHYGHKDKLHYWPIDQYNGKSSQTSSFHFLPTKQKKLHKQIANMLVTIHAESKAYNSSWKFE